MKKVPYHVSDREKFLNQFVPYQLYRFLVLNSKILRAVFHHPD